MQTKLLNMEPGANAKHPDPVSADLLCEIARLRGDLLTVARRINHDVQTPLGGIVTAGEALREILAETDPASLPLVASSLDCAMELSQLIKRTSFVLKATATPIPSKPTAMGDAVGAARQSLESRILKTGATVSEPGIWPAVNGVAPWLEVIWWNLLANALQHAGPAPRIELGWRGDHGTVTFWVADQGAGVPPERRSQLFQPFDRLHEPDAPRGQGLSFVQRLVELQGGACGYKTNAGGGACFFFTLATADGSYPLVP